MKETEDNNAVAVKGSVIHWLKWKVLPVLWCRLYKEGLRLNGITDKFKGKISFVYTKFVKLFIYWLIYDEMRN
jgi:hypothetical protein